MAALAVFLQDRRDILSKCRSVHIAHLRRKMRCRTNCKQQTENRAIHCVEASAAACVPILGAGPAIISRISNDSLTHIGGVKSSLATCKLAVEANVGFRGPGLLRL